MISGGTFVIFESIRGVVPISRNFKLSQCTLMKYAELDGSAVLLPRDSISIAKGHFIDSCKVLFS